MSLFSLARREQKYILHQSFELMKHSMLIFLFLASTLQTIASAQTDSNDQVSILSKFYYSTDGENWRDDTNWLNEKVSVCEWYGVVCFKNEDVDFDPRQKGMINSLELNDNRIGGTTPPELFRLPYLKRLNLKGNSDMIFSFSGIEKASLLEELVISSTGTSSLDGIGMANKTLKTLQLTDNGLKGSIPDEVYDLAQLEVLRCNYNRFTGTISTKIGNLVNLRELILNHNGLTGQIPSTIGDLQQLKTLMLAENALSGTLPESLNNMTALETFVIQNINKKGTTVGGGIGGKMLDFSKLEVLREFYASGNSLTGHIPETFLESIRDSKANIKIDLSGNQISGTIPASLAQFNRMSLFLIDNHIEGISRELCMKNNWMDGDVSSYRCDAILCKPGYFHTKGRQSSENSPCQLCPANTQSIYFGATRCDDLVQAEILQGFYTDTNGQLWKRSDGWLEEDVYFCDWYGITCKNGNVKDIDLKGNGLSGSATNVLFKIPTLESLDLSDNSIDVKFDDIGKATNLVKLTLSSVDLESIRGIGQAKGLKILNLESNSLTTMEADIFDLTNLRKLYLSHNQFSNSSLPEDISKLTNIEVLKCYECELAGPLPTILGSLSKMKELDLGENDFTGVLPHELGQLPNLSFLSLHQTKRSGEGISGPLIDFANAKSLTELYLDGNALTGDIPSTLLANSTKASSESKIYIGLSSNQLTGILPSELERFQNLDIDLSSNKITGIRSNLCQIKGWMDGKTAQYGCDAILCRNGTSNDFGRRTSDAFACEPCPPFHDADHFGATGCVATNPYESKLITERQILQKLYYDMDGANWHNVGYWLDRHTSYCDWYGITCHDEAGMEYQIKSIVLRRNGLKGTPPPEIFLLPHLEHLDLAGNNDINFSFDGIGLAANLRELDLSDTGLDNIKGIGRATSLKVLDLTDNNLEGRIPEEIYDLVGLEELYLNYNKLTGGLSSKINNLTNLRELYLYQNQLDGQIPPSIGHLDNIERVVLGTPELDILVKIKRKTN